MADVVWQLRGRARPSEDVLTTLREMHPHWRIAWQPGDATLPGAWVVYADRQADDLWRSAGLARLHRYMAHPTKETAGIRWATEAMIAGLQYVAEFPEAQFGTEHMWQTLRDVLDFEKANRQAIETALERQMAQDVVEEAEHSPAFRELLEETVETWWPRFGLAARSVYVNKGIQPQTAGVA